MAEGTTASSPHPSLGRLSPRGFALGEVHFLGDHLRSNHQCSCKMFPAHGPTEWPHSPAGRSSSSMLCWEDAYKEKFPKARSQSKKQLVQI